jgi:phosphoribosylformylglycinamidine synthase PurS subunit
VRVTVNVRRRPDIADPQGTTVARALRDLGFEVAGVRINKELVLEVEGDDPADVEDRVTEMCTELLANPVMDDFEITVG